MFELVSFTRAVAFAVVYGGIEYRYVNKREVGWVRGGEGFPEKPVLGRFTPYHVFLLLPLFIVVAFVLPLTAWAGNSLLLALVEDIAYFGWRGRWVEKGEWTTNLYGSFGLGGKVIPIWWPISLVVIVLLYLAPF